MSSRFICLMVCLFFWASDVSASILATVNGVEITEEVIKNDLLREMRERFYHGSVAGAEVNQYLFEILEERVSRILLLQEAERLGIKPDAGKVEEQLAQLDRRNTSNPAWAGVREQVLPRIRRTIADDQIRALLEQRVKTITTVSSADLRRYYDNRKDKFTEPDRQKVSLIMLGVEPSALSEEWQDAAEKTMDLYRQLQEGADFAAIAREHSSDPTSENGGDMGYVHSGMLGPAVEELLVSLEPGQVGEPLRLLEGFAIFRLDERVEGGMLPFEEVTERVEKLYRRDASEEAWSTFKSKLRESADLIVDEDVLARVQRELRTIAR